ncbi:hypothetical protein [Bizionia sp.]|uniref:hypothetical protein n=1 Tax=Bizionia sp. TaxID=1954480 RepID=UPI003A8E4DDF
MKTKLSLLVIMFTTIMTFAQNGINYKAVIKDNLGNIVANDLIAIQFTIIDGATTVYQETQTPTTDDNGIIIVNIGEGTPTSTAFSTVDWSSSNHFLNVQLNTGGGLIDMGTTAFKPVPYALMAKNVENTIWTKNNSRISYSTGDVGIGINNPINPLSVLQSTGLVNTVRIESLDHPTGKDLIELIVPSGSPSNSQFIEMQNGTVIVAAINSDGSAEFKSVQFEDNTVQTTAAVGPLAYGFVQSNGNVSSGSGNFSAVWEASSNRYEITIDGENYFYRFYTTNVTCSSSNIIRERVNSANGKLLIYLYNDAGLAIQGDFQFVTYK